MRRAVQSLRRFPLKESRSTMLGGTVTDLLNIPNTVVQSRAAWSVSSSFLSQQQPSASVSDTAASLSPDVREAFFDMLRQRLCSPTHPLPTRSVYDELTNRSRVVEDLHFSKTSRRLARQRLALSFLRRYNVLLHGLLFFSENTQTWNTTPEFQRLALFGESILSAEVRGRLLKLFPNIPYSVLVQSLPPIVGEEGLSRAFDRYDMKAIVGARPQKKRCRIAFTSEQKSHMLCAVVAEMYWFVARTRPTDRTHNNALFPPSDVLILHVLSSHLLECIPAELIYRFVEPIMADVRRVWVNEPMSVPSQLRLIPRTIGALSLNSVALPRPSSPSAGETISTTAAAVRRKQREAQSVRRALTSAPEMKFAKSFMQPVCNHRNFDAPRYQVLETDVAMEKCTLANARQELPKVAGTAFDSEAAWLARAKELAALALQK